MISTSFLKLRGLMLLNTKQIAARLGWTVNQVYKAINPEAELLVIGRFAVPLIRRSEKRGAVWYAKAVDFNWLEEPTAPVAAPLKAEKISGRGRKPVNVQKEDPAVAEYLDRQKLRPR
jgi:hypothetical protein